jgi:hypothetical protein
VILESHDQAYKIWADYTLGKWSGEFASLLIGQDWKDAQKAQDLWESVALASESGGDYKLPTHVSAGVFRHLVDLSGRFNEHVGFGLEMVWLDDFLSVE